MADATLALGPQDSLLVGQWVKVDGKIEGDATCRRIEELLLSHLKEIASDTSGWGSLLFDPADNRLWELTYPQSDGHGGGPPKLQLIGHAQAIDKYGSVLPSNKSLERTREG
jgi:hypothetical protein